MYYLIQTPHHPRPYLSTVSFVANDFANWGCRVSRYAASSPYISEIIYQERRNRPAHRRIELMEVWAKEVLARKQQRTQPATSGASLPEARKEKASEFVQDFISSLSQFESPMVAPKSLPNDPIPLPSYPLALVAKHTRMLHRCAYVSLACLPPWANANIFAADQVSLDFKFDKSIDRKHLAQALNEAVCKQEGRMGRVERCSKTGVTRVLMWVDIGDLLLGDCGKRESDDPVPVYEKGEWEWPPMYEECAY